MKKIIILIIVCFQLISCKKKNDENTPPTDYPNAPTGTLYFHLHSYVDGFEVHAYDEVYTTISGRKISLSMAQVYLSEIELVKLDGSTYKVSDKIVLKEQAFSSYQIGNVPVGNYKSIRFKIGLNETTNAKVPTSDAADPLNRPDMWFDVTAQPAGYVFYHLAGKMDTTVAANALEADMVDFEIKLGTNSHLQEVVFPDNNFSVVTDQVHYIHLKVDHFKLFDGISLLDNANLHVGSVADNNTSVANDYSFNSINCFSYDE